MWNIFYSIPAKLSNIVFYSTSRICTRTLSPDPRYVIITSMSAWPHEKEVALVGNTTYFWFSTKRCAVVILMPVFLLTLSWSNAYTYSSTSIISSIWFFSKNCPKSGCGNWLMNLLLEPVKIRRKLQYSHIPTYEISTSYHIWIACCTFNAQNNCTVHVLIKMTKSTSTPSRCTICWLSA